jgi:diguanylate cyclase (GGDEF)-like protein
MSSGVKKMHKKMKYIIITFAIFIFASASFSVTEKDNILYISSYSPSFMTFDDQIKGLKSVLKEDYILNIQYMDSKEFYSQALIEDFRAQLEKKMSMTSFDAIIVADDNAYNLALREKDNLFEGLPIIFLGINNQPNALKANDIPQITGVMERISIKETLDIGLKLQKETETVYVVTDGTPTGQSDLETLNNFTDLYPGIDFEILDTSEMTFDELAMKLKEIPSNDLLLFLSLYRDQVGDRFLFSESVDFVQNNSNVPILHIYKHGVGEGMVGGHVVDHFKQGSFAGSLVKDYFEKGSLEGISVIEESPNTYYFDAKVMKKYDLSLDLLPDEAMIINNELNFIEKYKKYIITFIVLFIFESILIIYLLYNLKKRREYESELIEANDLLEIQNEEIIAQYTELEETKDALDISRSRYILAFEGSNSGLFDLNYEKGTSYINAYWYNQYLEEPLEDSDDFSKLIEGIPPKYKNIYKELKEKILKSDDRIYDIEFFIQLEGSSEKRWILENGVVTRDQNGKVLRVTGSHREITHLKQNIKRINDLKVYDQLTKLYNRSALEIHLKRILSNNVNNMMAIILIDLDKFKYINDHHGHHRGDEILKTLANRMMQNNAADYISRFSGDEFILVLNNVESIDSLIEKLYEINYFIEKKIVIHGEAYHMSASFGVVLSPDHGTDYHELIRKADLAMYQVKNAKNNTWYQIYDETISDSFEKKFERIQQIQLGIKKNEFYMVYQPIIDCSTREIVTIEALMRWEHNGEFVSPDEFITLAEESGLIYELGLISIDESIKYLKEVKGQFNVSINFSAIQLKDPNLMDVLEKSIKEFGVAYEKIIIEITETTVIEDFEETIEILERMKALGLRIAIDDFGTGYSSLNYLTKLPIDILKVDKSFVQLIHEKEETMDLIEAIVAIAKSFKLDVVFEGVETKEQLEYLENLGANLAQGYYFHKPLSKEQLNELIDTQNK